MPAEAVELSDYGYDAQWHALAMPFLNGPDASLGRIAAQHRNHFEVITAQGLVTARGAGRLHQRKFERTQLPAVGDWVILRAQANSELSSIDQILPRRTQITRRAAGDSDRVQLVAANVDLVILVLAADDPRAAERLPRFLALIESSGARAQVVWNKIDLLPDVRRLPLVEGALHVSAHRGDGMDAMRAIGVRGQTVAMLGASGAGKSSLINAWLGQSRQKTSEVTSEARGRHTTTLRQLIPTDHGQVLLDTPGMRELGLWDSDSSLHESFPDIEMWATQCRFKDCHHGTEPGCAVQAALQAGELAANRLQRWHALQQEIEALQDPRRAAEHRRSRERRSPLPLARRWRA